MSKRTLNDRVLEAWALAQEGRVESRDKHNRVKTVLVPGSKATINQVILRRHNGGKISAECRKILGNRGYDTCKGNRAGVCRHSIAAMIIAVQDAGYKPYFRKNRTEARQLANRKNGTTLPDPTTGKPMAMALLSFQNTANRLYFVAEEEAAVELNQKRVNG